MFKHALDSMYGEGTPPPRLSYYCTPTEFESKSTIDRLY